MELNLLDAMEGTPSEEEQLPALSLLVGMR